LEYLVVVTVVIIAIFAIRETVQANMENVFRESAELTGDAASAIGDLVPE